LKKFWAVSNEAPLIAEFRDRGIARLTAQATEDAMKREKYSFRKAAALLKNIGMGDHRTLRKSIPIFLKYFSSDFREHPEIQNLFDKLSDDNTEPNGSANRK